MGSLARFLVIPVVALGLMVLGYGTGGAKADDTSATQPSTQPDTGSVKVTVTGEDGKPAGDVRVMVRAGGPRGAAGTNGGQTVRGAAVGQGTTDANGVVTIDGIPVGSYSVSARTSTDRGRTRATVTAGATAEVTIQLAAGTGGRRNSGASTQPAAQ